MKWIGGVLGFHKEVEENGVMMVVKERDRWSQSLFTSLCTLSVVCFKVTHLFEENKKVSLY